MVIHSCNKLSEADKSARRSLGRQKSSLLMQRAFWSCRPDSNWRRPVALRPPPRLIRRGQAPAQRAFGARSPVRNRQRQERKKAATRMGNCFSGAADQIRTGDLILTKDALYRLSYISNRDFSRSEVRGTFNNIAQRREKSNTFLHFFETFFDNVELSLDSAFFKEHDLSFLIHPIELCDPAAELLRSGELRF